MNNKQYIILALIRCTRKGIRRLLSMQARQENTSTLQQAPNRGSRLLRLHWPSTLPSTSQTPLLRTLVLLKCSFSPGRWLNTLKKTNLSPFPYFLRPHGSTNLLEGQFWYQKCGSKAKISSIYLQFTQNINWLSWSDPRRPVTGRSF